MPIEATPPSDCANAARRPPRRSSRLQRWGVSEALERRVLLAVTPVPVANHSFESAVGPDNNTAIAVADWDTKSAGNAFNPNDIAYANASDNSATAGALPAPADQRQVLFLNNSAGEATATQSLTTTLAADTIYTLVVAVGNRGDVVMDNYRIALFAGSTEISSATGDGEAATNSRFQDASAVSVAVPASSPLVGQPLRIVLSNLATKGGQAIQVNFDHVRLTATTQDQADPPTGVISGTIAAPGAAALSVTITYNANAGAPLDPSSLTASNIRLTGPNAYSQLATSVSDITQTGGGAVVTARYHFPAPGGQLDAGDNGAYEVSAEQAGVMDLSGNKMPAGLIGAFALDLAAALPDLTFASTTFTAGAYAPGATIPANLVAAVNGGSVTSFGLEVLLSPDPSVGGGNDVVLFTTASAMAGTPITALGPVLQSIAPGNYFLIVRLDPQQAVIESNEGNNTFVSATASVVIAPAVFNSQAELAFVDTAFAAGNYRPGDLISASLKPTTVVGNVAEFSVSVALSADSIAGNGDDILLQKTLVTTGISTFSSLGPIPGNTPVGSYHLVARIDPDNLIAEVDENNNTLVSSTAAIVIVPPPKPTVSGSIGGLDVTFGNGGIVRDALGLTHTAGVREVPGGAIIVAGSSGRPGERDIGLARRLANGDADTTFGVDGVVVRDLRGTDDNVIDFRILADGRILVAGASGEVGGAAADGTDFFVARFNADGSFDTSFGANGRIFIDFADNAAVSRSSDTARQMLLGDDGSILIAGRTDAGGDSDFALARLTPDGALDAGFGVGGRIRTDFGGDDGAQAAALTDRGAILAAGFTTIGANRVAAVALYSSSGVLDQRFGNKGLATATAGGTDERANAVAIASKGRVVIAGSSATGSIGSFDSDVLIARFNARGRLDSKFAHGGVSTVSFANPATATHVEVQPAGQILASGVSSSTISQGVLGGVDIVIVRLSDRGELDSSFGGSGVVTIPTAGVTTSSVSAANSPLSSAQLPLDLAPADPFSALLNSTEGKILSKVGGGGYAAGTDGPDTVITSLITSGIELGAGIVGGVPASVIGGNKGSFKINVVNVGDATADGTIEILFFASTDQVLDTGDHQFFTVNGATLKVKPLTLGGKAKSYKPKFIYPSDMLDGTYFVLAQVNATSSIDELDPGNNVASTSSSVNIVAPVLDLTGPTLESWSGLQTGKTSGIPLKLANQGTVTLKGVAEFILIFSADDVLDDGDARLEPAFAKVNIGASKSRVAKLKVKPSVAPGSYYVFVLLDASNVITERNEANNLLSSALPSTIR